MALIDFLISYVEQVSYLAIVILLLIGSVGIPFPEEIVLLVAGYVSSLGYMNVWGAVVISFIGVLAGDLLGYWIGSHHGKRLKRLLAKDKFRRVEYHFERHGSKTVFVSRFLAGVRVFFPIAAGATKMPVRDFLFWDTLAALIWVPVMVFLGFWFGALLPGFVAWFRKVDIVIGTVFVVLVIAALLAFKKRKVIKRKLEHIRHDFFTRTRRTERPFEVLLFGNPAEHAQRVYSKQRVIDKRVMLFVEFLRDGVEVKCLHSNRWLHVDTYRELVKTWSKKLGKPKKLAWPRSVSVARRS